MIFSVCKNELHLLLQRKSCCPSGGWLSGHHASLLSSLLHMVKSSVGIQHENLKNYSAQEGRWFREENILRWIVATENRIFMGDSVAFCDGSKDCGGLPLSSTLTVGKRLSFLSLFYPSNADHAYYSYQTWSLLHMD